MIVIAVLAGTFLAGAAFFAIGVRAIFVETELPELIYRGIRAAGWRPGSGLSDRLRIARGLGTLAGGVAGFLIGIVVTWLTLRS